MQYNSRRSLQPTCSSSPIEMHAVGYQLALIHQKYILILNLNFKQQKWCRTDLKKREIQNREHLKWRILPEDRTLTQTDEGSGRNHVGKGKIKILRIYNVGILKRVFRSDMLGKYHEKCFTKCPGRMRKFEIHLG